MMQKSPGLLICAVLLAVLAKAMYAAVASGYAGPAMMGQPCTC